MLERDLLAIMAAILYAGRLACPEGQDFAPKEAVAIAAELLAYADARTMVTIGGDTHEKA